MNRLLLICSFCLVSLTFFGQKNEKYHYPDLKGVEIESKDYNFVECVYKSKEVTLFSQFGFNTYQIDKLASVDENLNVIKDYILHTRIEGILYKSTQIVQVKERLFNILYDTSGTSKVKKVYYQEIDPVELKSISSLNLMGEFTLEPKRNKVVLSENEQFLLIVSSVIMQEPTQVEFHVFDFSQMKTIVSETKILETKEERLGKFTVSNKGQAYVSSLNSDKKNYWKKEAAKGFVKIYKSGEESPQIIKTGKKYVSDVSFSTNSAGSVNLILLYSTSYLNETNDKYEFLIRQDGFGFLESIELQSDIKFVAFPKGVNKIENSELRASQLDRNLISNIFKSELGEFYIVLVRDFEKDFVTNKGSYFKSRILGDYSAFKFDENHDFVWAKNIHHDQSNNALEVQGYSSVGLGVEFDGSTLYFAFNQQQKEYESKLRNNTLHYSGKQKENADICYYSINARGEVSFMKIKSEEKGKEWMCSKTLTILEEAIVLVIENGKGSYRFLKFNKN